MAKVTEEMIAQFIQLHRRGDSFRSIGARFQVDPRTVKSRIEKAERQKDRDHWVAVSLQVDVRYLEEHLGMLVRVSIDVQEAVQTSPFKSDRDPLGLVAALVATGLKRNGGLLESRGLDLRSPISKTNIDAVSGLPIERLAAKVLNSLNEHEPTLEGLLDRWGGSWLKLQRGRTGLRNEAINLFRHYKEGGQVAGALGPIAAGQAIASALDLPGQGNLTTEGLTRLMWTEGNHSRQICVVKPANVQLVYEAYEQVLEQLLLEERIRPLQEAYRSLTESVAEMEDLVDNIILWGKPRGTCFLCPRESRI